MRTVRSPLWPEGDREVEGDGRLADPALRCEHADDARAADGVIRLRRLVDVLEPGDQVEPGERHHQDAVDAPSGIRDDGLLWDGQHDHRDAEARGMDVLDDRHPLDPSLEQGVDDHDIGPQLRDEVDDLAAVGHHVEELDRALGVQQTPDVGGDLLDILDDEEADLVR